SEGTPQPYGRTTCTATPGDSGGRQAVTRAPAAVTSMSPVVCSGIGRRLPAAASVRFQGAPTRTHSRRRAKRRCRPCASVLWKSTLPVADPALTSSHTSPPLAPSTSGAGPAAGGVVVTVVLVGGGGVLCPAGEVVPTLPAG